MDTEPPSSQELENRKVLTKISTSLNIGIALPRAQSKCPNKNQICWGWNFNEKASIDSALKVAKETKERCFPKAQHITLIGFSNGGHVVNQIIKDCRNNEFDQLVSIGAGSTWNKDETKDLSQCGSITLIAGKKDASNYQLIKELDKWFKKRKANVKVIEHDDGHILPQKDLENILKSSSSL